MKITDERADQGSEAWLNFRKDKIGASDTAAILGISPWKTAFQLYEEKRGLKNDDVDNPAVRFGSEAEAHLRSLFEFEHDVEAPACCYVSDEEPWAMASLDGYDAANKEILEIKTCNEKVFEDAQKRLTVPEYYLSQALWQMFCLPEAIQVNMFFSHRGSTCTVKISRDQKKISEIVEAVKAWFSSHIIEGSPPTPTERDYVTVDEKEALDVAEAYLRSKDALEAAKTNESEARAALLNVGDDGNFCVGDLKVTKYYVGGFDYKKACCDSEIDLNEYKKPSSPRWRISVMGLDKN